MQDIYKKSHTISMTQKKYFKAVMTDVSILNINGGKSEKGKALWDTGANSTVIDKNIAKKLNLNSKRVSEVRLADGSIVEFPDFEIDMVLSNHIPLNKYRVGSLSLNTEDYLMIIGMDIIGSGEFSIKYNSKKKESIFQAIIIPARCMMREFHSRKQ